MRDFAVVFGIVFLLAGASGFIPGLSPPHAHPAMVLTAGSRLALGLCPVNVLHDLVHLASGVWGLLAARSATASFLYARAVAILYALLTILGLIPATDTTFGLVPIDGSDA